MGGVRHSGASHPLIILLSSFLPDTPSDRPRVPLSPHDEEFLDVVLLHPERSSRPRTYTHTFEVERPKKDERKSSFPFMTCHSCPSPIFPSPLSSFPARKCQAVQVPILYNLSPSRLPHPFPFLLFSRSLSRSATHIHLRQSEP